MIDPNLEFVLLWCGQHPFLFVVAAMIVGVIAEALITLPAKIVKNWAIGKKLRNSTVEEIMHLAYDDTLQDSRGGRPK